MNAPRSSYSASYGSSNHHKYASGGPLYHFFLGRFHRKIDALVAASQPCTVLDAGCGEGFIAGYLKQRHPDWQITGVDASAAAIDYAQAHFGTAATFQTGDVRALPFEDGAFDVVLCSEVLEHLARPCAAVRELKRVARQRVVLTVPREPYFDALSRLGRWLGRSPDPGHVNFWTKSSFQTFVWRYFDAPRFATAHIFQLAAARP